MSRRRWIADEVSGDRAILAGSHADHLIRALRARVGQEFDVVTPGNVRRGRVTSIEPGRVEFELAEEISACPSPDVILLLAIFKFDRMEWAIEKCTELGVARILPFITRRTNSHLASASKKRIERWRRIARQAAEQSRRAAAPEITSPLKVADVLNLHAGLRILLSESGERNLLRDALTMQEPETNVALAVGPEGGWTEDELRAFRDAGWISASLGGTILRVETAAIAAVAIVTAELNSK